jgi:hypothetical protein
MSAGKSCLPMGSFFMGVTILDFERSRTEPKDRTYRCCVVGRIREKELFLYLVSRIAVWPESPIFRHISQFFLPIAGLWPAKNRFVWRKMDPF